MEEVRLQKLRDFIKTKPYLIWYSKNYDNLSLKSIAESILNFGDWEDFISLKEIIGINNLNLIFKEITTSRRTNLTKKTTNYFSKYFQKYA